MRDFDDELRERRDKDRTFKVRGEEFTVKTGVRPETLTEYERVKGDSPNAEALVAFDRLILTFIEEDNDAAERWRTVRELDVDPVTLGDMRDIVAWIVEVQTARPTKQPLPSQDGQRPTGTTSTESSPSPAAVTSTR